MKKLRRDKLESHKVNSGLGVVCNAIRRGTRPPSKMELDNNRLESIRNKQAHENSSFQTLKFKCQIRSLNGKGLSPKEIAKQLLLNINFVNSVLKIESTI